MIILSGEIGKLSLDGEQVGGFKYWTAIVNKTTLSTTVIASKFWMLKKVETNKLEAEFYTEVDDRLKLIYQKTVTVELPEHKLDTMITAPLKMLIENFNWIE